MNTTLDTTLSLMQSLTRPLMHSATHTDPDPSALDDRGGRTPAEHIAFSVLRALAEQRLAPGMRLTEDDLGGVFGVSRTVVRQALTQLAAHGIVGVRPKKGWFIIEPPEQEIRDVFAARRLLEGALIREFCRAATPAQLGSLQEHVRSQREAIAGDDAALRTYLLTDFHVLIADTLGNAVVTRMIRDLTMRTNLIAMLYQTGQDASASCSEHAHVIKALKSRDADAAERLMNEHLHSVENGLTDRRSADPVRQLRDALSGGSRAEVRTAKPAERPARATPRTARAKKTSTG